MRHDPVECPVPVINPMLPGHYAYYGMAGNRPALMPVYQAVKTVWRHMLSSRSQKNYVSWAKLPLLLQRFPLMRPKLSIPYRELPRYAIL